MKPLDLSLYVVLDPDLCGGPAGMLETAELAARNGATAIQLRAPQWKKREWLETGRALKARLAPYDVALVVNDHVDVAMAIGADVIHVGQADLPVAAVRQLVGATMRIGLSISSLAELHAADLSGVDHLGVGPVFPTASKADAAPTCGLDGLAAIVRAAALPAVAIGGIHVQNCAAVLAAGAHGVAVISAICGQADPAYATRQLRDAIAASRA